MPTSTGNSVTSYPATTARSSSLVTSRPDEDRYWGREPEVGEIEAEAIEQVRACRQLADRLRSVMDGANQPEPSGASDA